MMTVTNKYVLSGYDFNLNFFLLCVQVSIAILLRPREDELLTYRVSKVRCLRNGNPDV